MMCGEIWWVDFGVPFGSEPGFRRPVVILQNTQMNESQINTVVVVPLTTNLYYSEFGGNLFLSKKETGLTKDSVALGTQITTIDKQRLVEQIHKLTPAKINEIIQSAFSILGDTI